MNYERSPLENEIGQMLQNVGLEILEQFEAHMQEPQHLDENPEEIATMRDAIEFILVVSASIYNGRLPDLLEVTHDLKEELRAIGQKRINEESSALEMMQEMMQEMIASISDDDPGEIPEDFELTDDDLDVLFGLAD
jgi:hypothetical protein